MKKMLSLFAATVFAFAAYAEDAVFKPFDMTVGDFFVNPIGYDLKDLAFSWKLPLERNGVRQTAYQIVVADSEEALERNPVWNSKKVENSRSVKILYNGKPLDSRKKMYWRVRVWDENDNVSEWSDVSTFETGLLSNSDWSAKWITSPQEPRIIAKMPRIGNHKETVEQKGLPPIYLRKNIGVKEEVVSARLYVASRGIFQFYINGQKVGNDYWGTGWTDYKIRIQANTYDVTKMLVEDDTNTLSAVIANGWYAGQNCWGHGWKDMYGIVPELLAQLEITYKNGKREIFPTDVSWKSGFGGTTFADIYAGEEFDANKEPADWKLPQFDDSKWDGVLVKDLEKVPSIDPRRNTPVVAETYLYPLSVKQIGEGAFIFDFGQNMVGVPRISIPSSPGRKIKIRYAEMLNPDGTMYTENYRAARSEDYYTCSGMGVEEWQPAFTFHGFRYVELSGFPANVKPSLDWIRGVVLHTEMPFIGSFVCSSQKINQLQSCIQWGQRGNFLSVPTDCPQRDERLGWTGDAQVFAPTAAFNMDVSAFFSKWMQDVRDAQLSNGLVPIFAPKMGDNSESPAWSDAVAVIPWEMYLAYGDEKILRDNYEAMKKWVEYQKSTSKELIRPALGFGDWLQPNSKNGRAGDTPKDLIGTAYFIRSADIVSKAAKVLGYREDSEKYSSLASDIRNAFMKKFVKEDNTVEGDCQTAYLLPLAFDIIPESRSQKVFEKLLKTIERNNWHLSTGFVGTPLINEVLTRFGRTDIAYKLLNNETYPSWLYPINQGATTMWERWNSYSHETGFGDVTMNSFNHYAYGAIGQWMYKNIAGLWYDENNPGYKNIIFAPKLGGGLTFANATHLTPYGMASSGWRISDGVMEWSITIPANATGTIVFPTKRTDTIRLNGHRVESKKFADAGGWPALENMPSGKYQILLRYEQN